jgi:hypothetical protein
MVSSLRGILTLYSHLKTIRAELLKVKVRKKSDIQDVHKVEGIKQALAELDKFNENWAAEARLRNEPVVKVK